MEQPRSLGQQRIVDLNRGMFVIRYETAQDERHPPTVRVAVAPGSERNAAIVLHPDAAEAVLWQPGSGLVVRVASQARLLVEVVPARPNGSSAATVKLEPLSQGRSLARPSEPLSQLEPPRQLDVSGFRLLGHLAGRGDILVRCNEWIGGPSAPARIEGIGIEWPTKPNDLDIHYGVRVAGSNLTSPSMVNVGSFAGTRGQAMPVLGLVLELHGPGSQGYRLAVEAAFLGAPATRMTGDRIALAGPTGREPLVGLRVGMEDIESNFATPQHIARKIRPAGGVRVFRGGARQSRGRTGN